MASETSELTFVRCPSCRSLVPATATRCRICNNPLEGTDGAAKASDSEAAKAASRVRQKTITATPEDVASALKQAKESAAPAVVAQTPRPVPEPEEPSEEGEFDPLSAYLEELEDEPSGGAKGGVGEAPYTIEATEPVAEPDDDFGFDIFDDLEPEVEQKGSGVTPEPDDLAPAPKAVEARQSMPKEVSLKPAPAARESAPPAAPAARTEEPRREEARREPPRPPPFQPQAKREQPQQSASSGKGDGGAVQQQHRAQNQDRQQDRRPRETAQQSRDAAPQPRRENREQQPSQSQPQQRREHQQQQQPSRPPPQTQRGGERPAEEQRTEPRRSEERRPQENTRNEEQRRHDDRRGDDRRRDERRQPAASPAPVVAEQVASVGPKTGKMRPGRLFGWFVSYENPDGRAIELREGKFFVTGSSIRPTDLILEDPSISTPHALMAVSAEGGLVIQDLMSDRGVFVRSTNGGGYRREEGTAHVGHGDWIRFGDVEFLVIVVPQGATR